MENVDVNLRSNVLALATAVATTSTVLDAVAGDTGRALCTHECHHSGECTSLGGKCIATRKEDCERSQSCANFATCSLDKIMGRCVKKTSDDCRRATECRGRGACHLDDGTCRATSDADCRPSDACRVNGECHARKGYCEATGDLDCKRSLGCTVGDDDGKKRCVYDRRTRRCKEGLDCSGACGINGRCRADDDIEECVAISEAACRASSDCADYGHCHLDPKGRNGFAWCVIRSAADCVNVPACKKEGECGFVRGHEQCEVTRDADCRRSVACSGEGRCAFHREPTATLGKCVAGSDQECERSASCKDYGRCSAIRGECVALSDLQCERSTWCREHGRCKANDGRCVALEPPAASSTREQPGVPPNGAPSVTPNVSPEAIRRVVRAHATELGKCSKEGSKSATSGERRVAVAFTIAEDGSVESAASTPATLPNDAVAECVLRTFRLLRFPASNNGKTRVTYPILFTPSE